MYHTFDITQSCCFMRGRILTDIMNTWSKSGKDAFISSILAAASSSEF